MLGNEETQESFELVLDASKTFFFVPVSDGLFLYPSLDKQVRVCAQRLYKVVIPV